MGTHQSIRKTVARNAATPEIPDKLYFRIGDVARICEVPAYVLRFWETEFPQLKPNKGGTGQRLYRKRDVEMALRIKSLLYDQGYTIPGARQVFKTDVKPKDVAEISTAERAPAIAIAPSQPSEAPRSSLRRDAQLQDLRREMGSLLAMLSNPLAASQQAPEYGKVKAMRPRLVLEPRPAKTRSESPQMKLEQRDLFSTE